MARGLQNFPNSEAPSSDYPDGRIVDDNGTNNGVPINEQTNGDIQQFFAKLMRDASVVPNGFPDNETNGYQLVRSLYNAVALDLNEFGWTNANLTYSSIFSDDANYPVQYRRIGNLVEWRGIAFAASAASGVDIFTSIPSILVPNTGKYRPVGITSGGVRNGSIEIRDSNTFLKLWYTDAGTSILVHFDSVAYYV